MDSLDSYEVYLDGASSFIEIENKNSLSDKELIIFRDSFGSSLIPLLINYYKKIGYLVFFNTELDEIRKIFKTKRRNQ